MKVLRKGKTQQRKLTTDVYDYQSIHLLAAAMQLQQLNEATFTFIARAKLIESRLSILARSSCQGRQIRRDAHLRADHHRLRETRKYYYDLQNPLLPLLIETAKGRRTDYDDAARS